MTGNQLFESFQFLDDALVEASEARPAGKTVWLRRGAAAAAVVLIAGAAIALPRLRKPQPGGVPGTEVFFTQPPQSAMAKWREAPARHLATVCIVYSYSCLGWRCVRMSSSLIQSLPCRARLNGPGKSNEPMPPSLRNDSK